MKMKTGLVIVSLMAVATIAHATLVEGQWLQLNFTDGFYANAEGTHWALPGSGGLRNWNYMTVPNGSYNVATDSDVLFDSLGNTVAGVAVTATNWNGGGWFGGPEWGGNGIETAAPDGLSGTNYLLQTDETINFWWANGVPGTNEIITISGLDTGLYYNVRLYALHPTEEADPLVSINLNGNIRNGARRGDRWNSTTTPFAWNSVAATASGDLEFIFNARDHDNPVINAIVIEAVTNPPPSSIVAGQWLQINFSDGWYVDASGFEGIHGGGGLRNWNYMTEWENPSYNASTAGSGLIDSQGNTVIGAGVTAAGWGGGGWSGGVTWGGNSIETAAPDALGGTNYLMQSDESINFWWALNGLGETVTVSGLDAGLKYNVKLYMLNNGTGNSGETTAVDLNGSTTASFTELARWNSTTTPYAWSKVSSTAGGELVFSIDATVYDNPVINAIVIEAVGGTLSEIGNIAVEPLPGTNGLVLTWATASGFDYTLQSKINLQDLSWATNTTVSGTGGDVTVTTAVDQVQSFYRVIGE